MTASIHHSKKQPLLIEFDWMVPEINDSSPSVLLESNRPQARGAIKAQLLIARNKDDNFRRWITVHTDTGLLPLVPFTEGDWYRIQMEIPTVEGRAMNLMIKQQERSPQVFQQIPMRNPNELIDQIRFLDNTPADQTCSFYIDNFRVSILETGQCGHSFDRYRLYIPNQSFEVGQGSWYAASYYGAGLEITRSEDAVDGQYSLQIASREPESTSNFDSPILDWPHNRPVQLRFWIKGSFDLDGSQARVELTSKNWGRPESNFWDFELTHNWQQHTIKIPAIENNDEDWRIRFRIPSQGWIRLDGIEMIEEPFATAPALIDPEIELTWESGISFVYPEEIARLHVRVGPLEDQEPPRLSGSILNDKGLITQLPPSRWVMDGRIAETIIDFGTRPIGLYNLDIRINDADGNLLADAQPSFACIHRHGEGEPWVGIFVSNSRLNSDVGPSLAKIGIPFVRRGASLSWHIRKGKRPGEWKSFDVVREELRENGLKELAILEGAPRSIRKLYGNAAGRWHRILGLHWTQGLRKEWENYVEALAVNDADFCGYESWNETNANSYFLGSTSTVADMLEANREALNRAGISPDHPVLGPTTSHIPQVYIRNVLGQVAPGTVDGVSIHPYRNGRGIPESTGYAYELDELRKTMFEVGLGDGHIWATELGISSSDLPRLEQAGLKPFTGLGSASSHRAFPPDDEVANYVLRAFIMGLTRGVDRQFYFLWADLPRTHLKMGLVRGDRPSSPKMQALSVSVLQYLFNGATFSRTLQETPPLYVYTFLKGKRQIVAAWSQEGRISAQLGPLGNARFMDRFGRPLTHSKIVTLSEAPIFIETDAGDPVDLKPITAPVDEPFILIQNQPISISLDLTAQDSLSQLVDVSCPSTEGESWDPWPLEVIDWRIEGDQLLVTVIPSSNEFSGFGFSELSLQTPTDEFFVSVPVKITTGGSARAPLDLLPNPGLFLQSTDQAATVETEGNSFVMTVLPVPDYWGPRFEGAFLLPPTPDITGYEQISFEVMTLEPTLNMQMRILMKSIDGTVYKSWVQPDVLTSKDKWQKITIPLNTFYLTKLSREFQEPQQPRLESIQSIAISVNGNDPKSGTKFRVRSVRLEPRKLSNE
ncbi:CIA30 family protein [Puniceicoccus vermicola]|uniref:CIA30 family protein n=1 Tax=Puniceicoccus vermicola TaxID=388746 RepID=A0A7X1B0Y9_9BACT|nr:CIA30 family protein [Puniceicoccus vermicola]MBC2603444.1 CIA30 family protein [Puniceicoccus vermicola]